MAKAVKGVLGLQTIGYEWKIERFFADCKKPGDFYESPSFPIIYATQLTNWYIEVYPKGNEEVNQDSVSIYLCYECESNCGMRVDYQLSMLSKKNNLSCEGKGKEFSGLSDSRGWERFVKHDVIKDSTYGFLIEDTLTIRCEIKFPQMAPDVTEYVYTGYDKWLSKIHEKTIMTYEELLESGSFTDVTFNVQDNRIHSHKAILSCRSPVFKAMFEHEMKEKKESSVDIVDVDYEVMKELFRFIYSGKVENIEEIAKGLLIAADKYSVIELKALCEKTLYNRLSVDNAIEYLEVTGMCDTLLLKKLTIKFVVDNFKKIAVNSDFDSQFAGLDPKVVCEIMKAVAEKM